MKTTIHPKAINLSLVLLGLVGVAAVYLTVTKTNFPLFSDPTVALAILVLAGMAMCTQGGIGRVAALQQWSHPLSILGYVLGTGLLIITTAAFLGRPLPFIKTTDQAVIAIALLSGIKIILSAIHTRLP